MKNLRYIRPEEVNFKDGLAGTPPRKSFTEWLLLRHEKEISDFNYWTEIEDLIDSDKHIDGDIAQLAKTTKSILDALLNDFEMR